MRSKSCMPCNWAFLSSSENKVFKGVVVAPHVPRTEGGLYWGYNVRLASSLSTPLTLAAHVLQSDFFFRLAADAVKLNVSAVHLPFHLLLHCYCRRRLQRESVRRRVRRDRRHLGEGRQHRRDDVATIQVGSEPVKIEMGLWDITLLKLAMCHFYLFIYY